MYLPAYDWISAKQTDIVIKTQRAKQDFITITNDTPSFIYQIKFPAHSTFVTYLSSTSYLMQ